MIFEWPRKYRIIPDLFDAQQGSYVNIKRKNQHYGKQANKDKDTRLTLHSYQLPSTSIIVSQSSAFSNLDQKQNKAF